MALEIKKELLNSSELFCQSKCEQALSVEINLPDYCSDIKRILKCIVTAGVSGVSVSGEAVSVSGSIVTRLVYVGEGEKIDCYEHTSPLSCNTQINNLPENAVFRTVTKTDYVNCRAVSQRRISISGNISTLIYAYRENKNEVPSEIKGMSVQCKKEKANITNLICQTEKTFDLSETVALDSEKSDIGKIIRCGSHISLQSKKAIADKLLIKGDLCCEILYADSDKGALTKIRHTMPISQIVNLAGVTDKSNIALLLSVSQFVVSAKNDSSGRCRLLEIAARISAFVSCREEKEISFIEDCYSTEYETAGEYKLTELSRLVMNEEKEITSEQTVDFSDGGIENISDMWCSDLSCNLNEKNGSVCGECAFLLCGIYTDKSGAVRYGERNVTAEINLPLKSDKESIRCDCSACVTSLEFSAVGGGKIKLKVQLSLNCCIYATEHRRLLCEIKIDENAKKEELYPALSLYFAQKGEKIWDIALRYNTTEALIKEENGLKGVRIEKDTMIMIPCV